MEFNVTVFDDDGGKRTAGYFLIKRMTIHSSVNVLTKTSFQGGGTCTTHGKMRIRNSNWDIEEKKSN